MVDDRPGWSGVDRHAASRLAKLRARRSPCDDAHRGNRRLDSHGVRDDVAPHHRRRAVYRFCQPMGTAPPRHWRIPSRLSCAVAGGRFCGCLASTGGLDPLLYRARALFRVSCPLAGDDDLQTSPVGVPPHPADSSSWLACGSRLPALRESHRTRLCPDLLAIDARL